MKSTKKLLSKIGVGTLGLLAGVGVFMSVASPSIFSADPQETVADDTFYQVQYDKAGSDKGTMSILLSAELSSYKGLNKQKLTDFYNVVKNAVSQAVTDDIGDSLMNSSSPAPLSLPDFTSLPVSNFVSTTSLSYSTVDVSFINQIVKTNMKDENGNLTSASVMLFKLDSSGANEQTVKFLADRYATAYAASSDNTDTKATAITKIANAVATAAQSDADTVFDASFPEPTPTTYNVVSDWITSLSADTAYSVDLTDLTNIYQDVQKDIKANPSDTYIADLVSKLGDTAVKTEIKSVLNDSESGEMVSFLTKVEPAYVAQTLKAVHFTKDDMMPTLDKIGMDNLVDVANKVNSDGLKTIFSSVEGLTKSDLTTYVKQNMSKVSLKKLFSTIQSLYVGDDLIYTNKKIQTAGVKALLKTLPRPSTIANYTDAQMKLSYGLKVQTSLGYVDIDLSVGFFGNCDLVRKAAKLIADTVNVYRVNGQTHIEVNVPNLVGRLVKYIDEHDLLDDSMKHRVFDFLFSTLDEQYNTLHNKTWASVLADLKSLDYEAVLNTVLSADNLNKLFGTEKFTQERVDKLVNLFIKAVYYAAKGGAKVTEKLVRDFVKVDNYDESKIKTIVDKVIELAEKFKNKNWDADLLREMLENGTLNDKIDEYIDKLSTKEKYFVKAQNVLTRLYEAIPERFRSKSIMDAYKGDGVFEASGTINLDYKKICKTISPTYGEKVYSYVSGLFDALPSTLNLDVKATFKNMRSVTYNINGTTKRGLLTEGMDVGFYANCESIVVDTASYDVVKWVKVDNSGSPIGEVTTMPNEDITVVPVSDFQITSSDNVNTIFDNNNHEISVSVLPVNSAYQYQWQRYDDDSGEWVDINGATSDKYNVKLVTDSGKYRCMVEYPGYLTKYSTDDGKDPINVIITNGEIDLSTVEFNYDETTPFVYDGTEQTISVVGSTLPSGNNTYYTYELTGDVAKTDAGTYTATAVFTMKPEYTNDLVFVGGEGTGKNQVNLTWKIDPKEVKASDFDFKWVDADGNEVTTLVYNGADQTVTVDDSSIPSYLAVDSTTYQNNSKKDAGTYTATVTLVSNSSNYVVDDEDNTISFTYTINPYTLDFSNAVLTSDEYTYDGSEKSASIDESTLPAALGSDTDIYTVAASSASGYDNKATNAGNYVAGFEVTINNPNYTTVNGSSKSLEYNWTINKAEITQADVDSITWTDSKGNAVPATGFEYTTKAQTVKVGTYPSDKVTLGAYTDATKKDAGTYLAKVALTATDNYVFADGVAAEAQFTWKIIPKTIYAKSLVSVSWVDQNGAKAKSGYTYAEETDHTLSVTNLPNGVAVESYSGDVTASNAGTYTVIAHLVPANDNYVLAEDAKTISYTWTINKASISFKNLKWSSTTTVEYNGQEQSLELTGTKPAGEGTLYTITIDNAGVDAGSYTAKVTIVMLNSNYKATNVPSNKTWTITPITYSQDDFNGVSWVDGNFVYDETSHTVTVDDSTLPTNTQIVADSYLNNKKTYAGTYVASAKVEAADKNYAVEDGVKLSYSWTIKQATVCESDLEGVTFVDNNGEEYGLTDTPSFAYNATKVTLSVKEDSYSSVKGVKLGYVSGNYATTVGNYTATVRFDLVDTNYTFEAGFDGNISLDWSITKCQVVLDDVAWKDNNGNAVVDNQSYPYQGSLICITVDEETIPTGVKLTNTIGNTSKNCGTFKAVATFKVTDSNYEIVGDGQSVINWSITKLSIDISSAVWDYVDTTPFVYDKTEKTVSLRNLPEGNGETYSVSYNGNKATEIGNYTATALFLLKDSYNYELKGDQPKALAWRIIKPDVKVNEVVSEEKDSTGAVLVQVSYDKGIDASYTLHAIKEDETALNLEKLDWTPVFGTKGGYVYASYDITFKNGEETVTMTAEDGSSFKVSLLIPEEYRNIETLKIVHISDDGTITELTAQKEGNYMKFDTTHFSRYAIVDIKGSEVPWWVFVIIALCVIIIALQVVILLRKFKKDDNGNDEANDAPVEPVAPVEEKKEEPVVELKPIDETPVEEPKEAEGPVEVEEERPAEPEANYIVDEATGTKQLLVRSFTAKLCQTTDEVKAFYNDFKNNIMAYRLDGKEKVRSVISWKYEAFYCGREIVCKLKIKRRNIMIYSPLDPKQFDGTPVKVEDVGGAKSTADTPTLMVITSDRKVRYANRMVDAVLAPLGLKLDKDVKRVDYLKGFRYASNKTLLAKGLIKTSEAPADLFKN